MDRQRRSTFTFVAVIASAVLGLGGLVLRAFLPWIARGSDGRWRIGPRERFAPGTATLLRRAKAIVVHDEEGLHALTAICTHEGCLVHDSPARKEIACPCHGAAYTYRGEVKRGPARFPLKWLSLTVENGELVLDSDEEVPPSA